MSCVKSSFADDYEYRNLNPFSGQLDCTWKESAIQTLINASPAGADTQVQFNDGGVFGGDAGFTFDKTTDSVDIAGHMAIGADASVSSITLLDLDETLTFANTTGYGIFADLYLEPGAALTGATHLVSMDMQSQWNGTVDGSVHASVQGIKGEGVNRAATGYPINQLVGVYGKSANLGQSDVTESIAGLFQVTNDDAIGSEIGDVTNAYSMLARAYTDKGTGVIGTRYGLYVEDTTGGGLLTNQYGIYIEDMASGSASGTAYAIYSLGGDVELTDGDLEIIKVDPEIRMTTTGDSNSTFWTRTDTDALTQLKNTVLTPGASGKAITLDGADQYLVYEDPTGNFSFGNGTTDSPFSVNAWINMDDATLFHVAHKWETNSTREWRFYVDGTDHLRIILYDEPNDKQFGRTASAVLTGDEGSWIMVTMTYDGSGTYAGLKVWRNAVQIDDTNFGNPATYTSMNSEGGDLYVGTFQKSTYSNGKQDELVIYDKELSQAEITALYGAGGGVYTTDLTNVVGGWHFDDETDPTEDLGTGGYDLTLINAPTFETGKVNIPGSDQETLIFKSRDGINALEKGIQQFGDPDGRTVIEGDTIRFSIDESEVGQIDATGKFDWDGALDATTITGTSFHLADNQKAYYGTGDDATIYFNDTNLIIDPAEVGAGSVYIGPTANLTLQAGTLTDGTLSTTAGVITGIVSLDGSGTIDLEDNLDGTGFTITGGSLTDGTTTLTGGELLDLATIEATTTLGIEIGDVQQLNLTDGKLAPTTDSDIDLGDTTHYFKDAYIDSITLTGDITSTGRVVLDGDSSMADYANSVHTIIFGDGQDSVMGYDGADTYITNLVGTGSLRIGMDLDILGDTWWTGSGTGLPYGDLYVHGNTTGQTIATATLTQVTTFDTNGESNLTTPDHTTDDITILKTGKYLITISSAFSGDPNVTWLGGAYKNNGATQISNIQTKRKLGAGGDVGSVSISGIASLTANDTLEVWFQHAEGVNKSITVEELTLSVVMVGG